MVRLLALLFTVLIFGAQAKSTSDPGYECFNYLGDSNKFYNIAPLDRKDRTPPSYSLAGIKVDLGNGLVEGTITVNFCTTVLPDTESSCPTNMQATGFFEYGQGNCVALSDNKNKKTSWRYSSYPKSDGYVIEGQNAPEDGVFKYLMTL